MIPVVFDLDGTLVDSAPDMALALNVVMGARGHRPFSLGEVRGFIGDGVPMLIHRALAARDVAGEDAYADWHDAYMQAYARGICIQSRPYPGVIAALDALGGRMMAVCTNKPQALAEDLLDALSLRARFELILGGDTGAGRKPDPTPLRHVATHMGATRAVMVGDSMADAGAARAAGWPMLLYRHGYRDRPADAIPADARFDDWAEFPALLAGLSCVEALDGAPTP